ncbi:MAG: DUF2779 domain-containing protein [Actinobacteria bacterium]|nr:DUF2779 domain-containing protein [Actinomycetota bacterium]
MRTFRLSKSRITAGLQCGKRLWLAVHRPDLEVYGADAQRRFAMGNGVGAIARELYPGGILIAEGGTLSQALRETEEALARPGDVILYEAAFRHKGVLVRADVLERRGGRCRMVEVKSATRLKEHHLQDIAIQGWVAEGAGLPLDGLSVAVIDTGFVYPGGGDYRGLLREIPVADQARPLMAHIPGWVRGLNEVLAGPLPAMRTGPQCRRPFECPFVGFCEAQEGKTRCGAGEERDGAGACAVSPDPALGTLDPAATAFLATLPYPRYYLDFETVQFAVPVWPGTSPFQQVVFQWSCHVEERPGELVHREFLDTSGDSPVRSAAEALLEALGDRGPIFVYHDFEKWRIMEMAAMLPDLAPALDAVAGRLVDLLRLTRDHYRHPALNGSYSLKTVLPTVDAELDHALLEEVQDGLSAQAAYHEAVDASTTEERRLALRASLLEYCGLDTLALVRVAHRFAAADAVSLHPEEKAR